MSPDSGRQAARGHLGTEPAAQGTRLSTGDRRERLGEDAVTRQGSGRAHKGSLEGLRGRPGDKR